MLNSIFSLVVLIVVDQFRMDEMLRHRELMAKDGIEKLYSEGISYEDAHFSNFYNMTCVGHAAIASGAPSAMTGIMANRRFDREKNKPLYCVEDANHRLVNAEKDMNEAKEFGTSAAQLKVTTITDEAKALWGDQSKIVSVAGKDRAAILLGGHVADRVFFYAPLSEIWTTSTAYSKGEIPPWLKKFNEDFKRKPVSPNYDTSPQHVEDIIDLALLAAKEENLGGTQRSGVDFLTIGISTHDHVGHEFGDDSEELKKIIQVEDKAIARLMASLKKQLGARFSKTLFVLTADHGASMSKKLTKNLNLPGGLYGRAAIEADANKCLGQKDGVKMVQSTAIYLSEKVAQNKSMVEKLRVCLEKKPGFLQVVSKSQLLEDRFLKGPGTENLAKSFSIQTGPDLMGVLAPNWGTSKELGSHETPHAYDSWVPLVFWSEKISKTQKIYRKVDIASLAPTLAFILNTRRPTGAGAPLLDEVIADFKRTY